MDKSNYLIGYGERLVSDIKLPRKDFNSDSVYSYSEVLEHTKPQWTRVQDQIWSLAKEACPSNRSVFSVTLHPKFMPMSYYPGRLFSKMDLEPIGSRLKTITPRKPRSKKKIKGEPDLAPEYFLSVDRDRLINIIDDLSSLEEDIQQDFAKIEEVNTIGPLEKIKIPGTYSNDKHIWEAVLHGGGEYVFEGFKNI